VFLPVVERSVIPNGEDRKLSRSIPPHVVLLCFSRNGARDYSKAEIRCLHVRREVLTIRKIKHSDAGRVP
jgi:hypothetical protein